MPSFCDATLPKDGFNPDAFQPAIPKRSSFERLGRVRPNQLIGAGAVRGVATGSTELTTRQLRELWPPRDIFQGDREGVRAVGIAPGISTESSHISIVPSKSFGRASEKDLDGPGEVPAEPNVLDCCGWTAATC